MARVPSRSLTEAKVGDKAVIRAWRSSDRLHHRVVTIKRVNPKSVTTSDDERWDYNTRRRVGDPGIGSSTTLELWDEDRHPYEKDAEEALKLIAELYDERRRLMWKQLAAALPHINKTLSVLKGEST